MPWPQHLCCRGHGLADFFLEVNLILKNMFLRVITLACVFSLSGCGPRYSPVGSSNSADISDLSDENPVDPSLLTDFVEPLDPEKPNTDVSQEPPINGKPGVFMALVDLAVCAFSASWNTSRFECWCRRLAGSG